MRKILITVLTLVLLSSVSLAATPSQGNITSNPVMTSLQKLGAKLFYLGKNSGLDGWLIVKDGQIQIAYAAPDNKSLLIGALFGPGGENITAQQVTALMQSNKEIADLISSAQKEQTAIAQAGSPAPAAPPTSTIGTMPATILSPGERLVRELSASSTIVVGNVDSPEILMVMDPKCPHCQATWKALHDSLVKGTVHLRMIPIGTQGTDNERAAAILLGVSDPLTVWDKYVNGDATALAGTPPESALAAIRANHIIIDEWKISNTPYIVYRAKDGKVKIVQGTPDKISTIFTDLGV